MSNVASVDNALLPITSQHLYIKAAYTVRLMRCL